MTTGACVRARVRPHARAGACCRHRAMGARRAAAEGAATPATASCPTSDRPGNGGARTGESHGKHNCRHRPTAPRSRWGRVDAAHDDTHDANNQASGAMDPQTLTDQFPCAPCVAVGVKRSVKNDEETNKKGAMPRASSSKAAGAGSWRWRGRGEEKEGSSGRRSVPVGLKVVWKVEEER